MKGGDIGVGVNEGNVDGGIGTAEFGGVQNARLSPEVGVLGRGVIVAAGNGGMEDGNIGMEMFGTDSNKEAAGVGVGNDDMGLKDADGERVGDGNFTGDPELTPEVARAFCGSRDNPEVLGGQDGGDGGLGVETGLHHADEGGASVVGLSLQQALAAFEVKSAETVLLGIKHGEGVHGDGGDGERGVRVGRRGGR